MDMLELARQALERAYAPYSRFPVAAVVRGASGRLHAGCNVENAVYPLGCCAETAAIAAMVMAGETRLIEVVLLGQGTPLITPCGGCRQRLWEFAAPDTPVHLCGPEGIRKTVTLGELLPLAFGPEQLP
ncbi:MAG: cytidine deaminase [Candidatus Competibacteraceae bacterium]